MGILVPSFRQLGVITDDDGVIGPVAELAQRLRTRLLVGSDDDARLAILALPLDVAIIDYRMASMSLGVAGLPPFVSRAAHHGHLVVFSGDACGFTTRSYPRERLGDLLADLSELLRVQTPADLALDGILGESPEIGVIREQVRAIGPYHDVPVLILGETGTGKELVAESVHRASGSSERPFVAMNCAAIPEHLFESELFGHEAGAYTGARGARTGLLEAAADGTVFFDEIGEMPLAVQAKLLRVLETRTFRRLGSNRDIKLRARIVSATNRRLSPTSDRFRSDLLYRLAGFMITLPSLRERSSDIAELAESFLQNFSRRHRSRAVSFTAEALAVLRAHPWHGNVRELRLLVENVAIVTKSATVDERTVEDALRRLPRPETLRPPRDVEPALATEVGPLRDVERTMIVQAFERAKGNLSQAAKQLSLPRSTLRDKLRRYGLL